MNQIPLDSHTRRRLLRLLGIDDPNAQPPEGIRAAHQYFAQKMKSVGQPRGFSDKELLVIIEMFGLSHRIKKLEDAAKGLAGDTPKTPTEDVAPAPPVEEAPVVPPEQPAAAQEPATAEEGPKAPTESLDAPAATQGSAGDDLPGPDTEAVPPPGPAAPPPPPPAAPPST